MADEFTTSDPTRQRSFLLYYGYHSDMGYVRIDAYVMETLMPDRPARSAAVGVPGLPPPLVSIGGQENAPPASHRAIGDATGLSKSAVQQAVRTLTRRRLVHATRDHTPSGIPPS